MRSKKARNRRPLKLVRNLLFDKRAVSVALSTMIITAGVIAAGIAVLYWAYSWGNIANDQYANATANSMSAIQENLAFEYVVYSDSKLTVNMINCGMSNNVGIARVYIWNNYSQPVGTFQPDTPGLMYIGTTTAIPGNSLNKGMDGYFNITVTSSNLHGYYLFRIVTERGRNFDGSFSAP